MEWLRNLALPQSAEHIQLLGYMFVIVQTIFISFTGLIFWGTIISIYFKKKAQNDLDPVYKNAAQDIIHLILFNRTTGLLFSILPLVAIILIFAQLFQLIDIHNLTYLTISFIFSACAILLLYDYKNSFDDFRLLSLNSAVSGAILLFIALWMFNAGLTSSIYGDRWLSTGFFEGLFSLTVLLRFGLFLLLSLVIMSAALLFALYYVNENINDDYVKIIRAVALRTAFIGSLLIPVLLVINFFLVPAGFLSESYLVYILLGLFLIFITYHILYTIFRKLNKTSAASLLLAVLLFTFFYVLSDKEIVYNANKVNAGIMSADFNEYIATLRTPEKPVELNGEEIYRINCSACHDMNRILVGPAHVDVIPKYFNKEDQLTAYIRNPIRVNTNFPPMPNLGLKPDEARAVAVYVIQKVKDNIGE